MSYDHGPLRDYEVTRRSGHVETIKAHQCILPATTPFGLGETPGDMRRVTFHGAIDGRWQLILTAPESEILTVRNITVAPEAAS